MDFSFLVRPPRAARGQCDFFTFRVKRENVVVAVVVPSFILFPAVRLKVATHCALRNSIVSEIIPIPWNLPRRPQVVSNGARARRPTLPL